MRTRTLSSGVSSASRPVFAAVIVVSLVVWDFETQSVRRGSIPWLVPALARQFFAAARDSQSCLGPKFPFPTALCYPSISRHGVAEIGTDFDLEDIWTWRTWRPFWRWRTRAVFHLPREGWGCP